LQSISFVFNEKSLSKVYAANAFEMLLQAAPEESFCHRKTSEIVETADLRQIDFAASFPCLCFCASIFTYKNA
jgi:hypothetical protein